MPGVSRQPLLSDKNRNEKTDNNYSNALLIHAKRIDPLQAEILSRML
jgi:hypothetical protein